MPNSVKSYMFPGSDAALAAKLMLDHKGVSYREVRLPPGLHAFIMLALGFESMGVPAIEVDGTRVQGSRWIARALDELVPEPPLFPGDAALRRKVEETERWGEGFQDAMRRLFYCACRRDRRVFISVMEAGRGRPMRLALRAGAPLIVPLAAGAHHATDAAGREDLAMLPERLNQIDAWIEGGVLGAAELNAADFQIAPCLARLLASADLWPHVAGRPAEALARRVLPCVGERRLRLAPPEWLAPGSAGRSPRKCATKPRPPSPLGARRGDG